MQLTLVLVSSVTAGKAAYVVGEDVALRDRPNAANKEALTSLRINTKVEVVSTKRSPWISVRVTDDFNLESLVRHGHKTGGFVHQDFLSNTPANFDALLTAAREAEVSGDHKKALRITVRAVAYPGRGLAILPSLEKRLTTLKLHDAAARVRRTLQRDIEYIARCQDNQLLLVAEQHGKSKLAGLARAADLPAWHRALIRADIEHRQFSNGTKTVRSPSVRWIRSASDGEDVSLAEISMIERCQPGATYATSALERIESSPASIKDVVAGYRFAEKAEAKRGVPSLLAYGIHGCRVAYHDVLDVQVAVKADFPLRDHSAFPQPRLLKFIAGAGRARVYWTSVEPPQAPTACPTWYHIDGGPVFRVGYEARDLMWDASRLHVVTISSEGEIATQSVPLLTGGC